MDRLPPEAHFGNGHQICPLGTVPVRFPVMGQGEGALGSCVSVKGRGSGPVLRRSGNSSCGEAPHPRPSRQVRAECPQRAGPRPPWQGGHWGCPGLTAGPHAPPNHLPDVSSWGGAHEILHRRLWGVGRSLFLSSFSHFLWSVFTMTSACCEGVCAGLGMGAQPGTRGGAVYRRLCWRSAAVSVS